MIVNTDFSVVKAVFMGIWAGFLFFLIFFKKNRLTCRHDYDTIPLTFTNSNLVHICLIRTITPDGGKGGNGGAKRSCIDSFFRLVLQAETLVSKSRVMMY